LTKASVFSGRLSVVVLVGFSEIAESETTLGFLSNVGLLTIVSDFGKRFIVDVLVGLSEWVDAEAGFDLRSNGAFCALASVLENGFDFVVVREFDRPVLLLLLISN
jgi:hypothetical protein